MRYMDALAIFEMAVELFAVYFCVSYLFRMHKDKPLYVVVLLGVVFFVFSFFTRFSHFYFKNGIFRRNRQEQP